MHEKKHLLVLASPSGGGKSTVARHLLGSYSNLKFSVSATTRPKRPKEIDGKDYYFLSLEKFLNKIQNNELAEYEEIYGNYYGTLKSEIEKARTNKECIIFDVDVKGALSIRQAYPDDSLLIFLSPINLKVLEERLRKRGTESDEQILSRLSRAEMEMTLREKFDYDIINDNLKQTLSTVEKIVEKYLALK